MPSSWSEIPTEIFLLILKPIYSGDLCNISLVCKNWNQLYKTTFDHLPRLEYFVTVAEFSYLPLLDALLRGKLAELKCIHDPIHYDWSDLDNYARCVLRLKDRLEHVTVFDTAMDGELWDLEEIDNLYIFYERISRIMQLPHSFTELTDRKRVNDNITYAESIRKKCKHLNALCLTVEPDFFDEETSPWTLEMIRNRITPIKTIKKLTVSFNGPNIDEFVYYLRHKFLNVESIQLFMKSPNPMSSTMCSSLISYLSSIPRSGDVWIPIRTEAFEEVVSDQANLLANVSSYSLGLDMTYKSSGNEIYDALPVSQLIVHRRKSERFTLLKFNQLISRLGLEYVPFLEKYGRYIRRLTVEITGMDTDTISPDYLLSLFRNSSNLEHFSSMGNAFDDFDWEGESLRVLDFQQMKISNGRIHENMLVNLSCAVKIIRLFHLESNQYNNLQNESGPYININMKSTTVDRLVFYLHRNTQCGKRYFYLNINTARHGDLYYMYDTGKRPQLNQFETSSKEEFNDIMEAHNIHLSSKFKHLTSINVKLSDFIQINLKLGR